MIVPCSCSIRHNWSKRTIVNYLKGISSCFHPSLTILFILANIVALFSRCFLACSAKFSLYPIHIPRYFDDFAFGTVQPFTFTTAALLIEFPCQYHRNRFCRRYSLVLFRSVYYHFHNSKAFLFQFFSAGERNRLQWQ